MKIEKLTPAKPHPLADIATWYAGAEVGETVRVSELPMEYAGRSADSLEQELSEIAVCVRVENANPKLRTPNAYLITKLA